jgi:hypothetical protein
VCLCRFRRMMRTYKVARFEVLFGTSWTLGGARRVNSPLRLRWSRAGGLSTVWRPTRRESILMERRFDGGLGYALTGSGAFKSFEFTPLAIFGYPRSNGGLKSDRSAVNHGIASLLIAGAVVHVCSGCG